MLKVGALRKSAQETPGIPSRTNQAQSRPADRTRWLHPLLRLQRTIGNRGSSQIIHVMRTPHAGCSSTVTGVSDPDRVIDVARGAAVGKAVSALAKLRTLRSQTIRQLDRHFHCPSVSYIREIISTFGQTKSSLPSLPFSCGDSDCKGTTLGVLRGGSVRLCSRILPVFVDQGGKYFIYHSGLPGGRVYTPGEDERYYLPEGRPD